MARNREGIALKVRARFPGADHDITVETDQPCLVSLCVTQEIGDATLTYEIHINGHEPQAEHVEAQTHH